MSKELSGAAGDVLHALFFRGALVDGDLPSKAGAAELRELGYVMTQASELQSPIEEMLDSIRKSDVFKVLSGQSFINDLLLKGAVVNDAGIKGVSLKGAFHFTTASDQCLMETAITESINQAVNDAIANARRPGGLLYARK